MGDRINKMDWMDEINETDGINKLDRMNGEIDKIGDKRHPLREKILVGAIPCERCFLCGHPREVDPVSGAKVDSIGFKQIKGVEYMLLREGKGRETVYMYMNECLPKRKCCCVEGDTVCLSKLGSNRPIGSPFITTAGKKGLERKEMGKRLSINENSLYYCSAFNPPFIEYSPFSISSDRVIRGLDKRTTCMIKNIPNKLTQRQLLCFLSSICFNSFDFLYLRMDFRSNCNNGYAFINFREPRYIPVFQEAIQGKKWKNFKSEKRAEIAYARIQGLSMLQTRFRRSEILSANKEFWPIIFNEQGEEVLANKWMTAKKRKT